MGEKSKGLYNFYISYADDGHSWVHGTFLPRLHRAGKTYLLEDAASNVGEFWLQAMQDNIQQSERVVVVLSPQYLLTHQKQFITAMTMTKGVEEQSWPLVPILLKGANADLVLRSLHVIDLTDDEDGVRLNALLGGEWDKPLAALFLPYPGMKAFEENQSAHFFGREAEISGYIDYLRLNHFLGLIGPSGCGKSSLVRAGIVPILKKRSYCDLFGGGDWAVHVFRAGSPDFHAWLAPFSGSNGTEKERVQELLSAGEDQASRLLLVVDQFEELFSLDRPEEGRRQGRLGEKAIQVLQQLARLVGVPSVYVILTVRDEFYPQIILCQEWLKLHAHLHPVGSLSRQGLQDAIVLPARGVGVYIQDELVERLLNDAGDDPGILPFVQETMYSLWARMEAREITLDFYEALGTKEVNGLRHSIAAKADSAFKFLPSDKHKDIAKRIFIRLIQFGEGRPDTRRQQSVASLQAGQESDLIFDEVLSILSSVDNRLLTISKIGNKKDNMEIVVDIVHESLIKNWLSLQTWFIEVKGFEHYYRLLAVKEKEWRGLGKNAGFLDNKQIKEFNEKNIIFSKNGLKFDSSIVNYVNSSIKKNRKDNFVFFSTPLVFVIFLSLLVISIFYGYTLFLKSKTLNLNDFIFINKNSQNQSLSINKYEVSNEQYCFCIESLVCNDAKRYDYCSDDEKYRPVREVSIWDAETFCHWIDARLPTETEWNVGAEGLGKVNAKLGFNIGTDLLSNVKDNGGKDVSKHELYNMGGNLSEWIQDNDYVGNKEIIDKDQEFLIKGGSVQHYMEYEDSLSLREFFPGDGISYVGFRCVTTK